MIPPLQQELAQIRQAEMRLDAARHRLARQARADDAAPSIRLPRPDFLFLRLLLDPLRARFGTGAERA